MTEVGNEPSQSDSEIQGSSVAEEVTSTESCKENTENESNEDIKYELIDGCYYYTDETTGTRYRFDNLKNVWVNMSESVSAEGNIVTDDEGRTYYCADGYYLCHDSAGSTYYMDQNNEWQVWSSESNIECNTRWYFYKGDEVYYRDIKSNTIYKRDKETNEWQKSTENIDKRRRAIDNEEEFDSDEEEDEVGAILVPPGYPEDPNINFDGEKYTKKDPQDNMVYEWDIDRSAWFPKLDEDFMATYQLSYGFNPDGTKMENPLKIEEEPVLQPEPPAKKTKALQKKEPTWFEVEETQNTKVYVSNLPDISEDEFVELMQKCGLVLKDEANKFKIKLYKDPEGNFKGDALCTYIKKESVQLALQILDGYQVKNKKVKVELAKFTLKGEYNPSLKPKKKRKKDLEKIQKKQEKLFDWRPDPLRGERAKHESVVIIKSVFDPAEFIEKPENIFVIKESIKNLCETFGAVKRIELYDTHPEGVVQVFFQEVECADMCIPGLHGKLYSKRTLNVCCWDGREKFKKEETTEEKEARLKKWNEYLEEEKES